jgi:hypothetical protein
MKYNNHFRKRLPASMLAVAAVVTLSGALLPFSSAEANSGRDNSPAASIAENFFKWRNEDAGSTSRVWDLLPPGIAKKIFEGWQMPGVGNDNEEPMISDIDTEVTDEEVTLSWQTDEKTRGIVYVSTEEGVEQDDEETIELSSWKLSKTHVITTDDLQDDTTYYAIIKATDKAGNETLSEEFSFSTESEDTDEEGPQISGVDTEVTDTTATVSWNTDEAANSRLYVSTTTPVDANGLGTIEVSDEDHVQEHELTATGLAPDTTYYAMVTSADEAGNNATSSSFSFTTAEADDEDAPVITAIEWDSGTSTIDFSWTTDEPATSALFTSTTSGFSIDDAGVMEESNNTLTTNHDLTLSGLSTSTTYYHRIVSVDASGNKTTSAQFTIGTN